MIVAEIWLNNKLIMSRAFDEQFLSQEQVFNKLEFYVVQEKLNNFGECTVRVRTNYGVQPNSNIDLSDFSNSTFNKMRGIG